MAHMSVPCHEGPPATKGHFSSEPAVAGRGRYYCTVICKEQRLRVQADDRGKRQCRGVSGVITDGQCQIRVCV